MPPPLELVCTNCHKSKIAAKIWKYVTSFEFHIIGATLVPQPLRLYNILCGGTPLIQLSRNTQNLGYVIAILHPMWQYFETFVHRNPLIRDKILFQALFLDDDQVYFLRYKHANSTTVFLLWYAGHFTRSDLTWIHAPTIYAHSNSNILGLPE